MPQRSPQNIFSNGITTVQPASTARFHQSVAVGDDELQVEALRLRRRLAGRAHVGHHQRAAVDLDLAVHELARIACVGHPAEVAGAEGAGVEVGGLSGLAVHAEVGDHAPHRAASIFRSSSGIVLSSRRSGCRVRGRGGAEAAVHVEGNRDVVVDHPPAVRRCGRATAVSGAHQAASSPARGLTCVCTRPWARARPPSTFTSMSREVIATGPSQPSSQACSSRRSKPRRRSGGARSAIRRRRYRAGDRPGVAGVVGRCDGVERPTAGSSGSGSVSVVAVSRLRSPPCRSASIRRFVHARRARRVAAT